MPFANSAGKHSGSITRKLIFAFLLAGAGIYFSWRMTRGAFVTMQETVQSMAEPSPKLQFVNRLFREVVMLDQEQRVLQFNGSPLPGRALVGESHHVRLMLDTLREMSLDNPGQLTSIDSMRILLKERDRLLLNYLELRSDIIRNDTLSTEVQRLSELLAADSSRFDSSVITTEKKTTTIVEPVDSVIGRPETRLSFWDRLTGRRKEPEVVRMKRFIKEDLKIQMDTLAMAKEDSLLQKISAGISSLQSDMQRKREGLVSQQVQLTRAGNMLISRILIMLQDIESEELDHIANNNTEATRYVNNGIYRMKVVLALFMGGSALLMLLIFVDIGRSNRYRRELLEAKEEAEQLGQVKERFLANMSHELRTPLQTIIGVSEQMKRNEQHRPDDISVIHHSAQHLLQSVNEVLDYNRITAGRITLERKPFDMEQLVLEVGESMRILAQKKGIGFYLSSDKLPGHFYSGDAFRLKQILYNLLGNAVKFTDSGQVSFRVRHRDNGGKTLFVFSVKDTGPGIAPENRERIFRKFERFAPETKEGAGLGLSIVRELADVFGGTIELYSTPGEGSEFRFSVLLARADEVPQPETAEPVMAPGTFREMVWVVDDDVFILRLCADILTRYGVPNRAFNRAEDLLEAARDVPVHTVLMDIRMPGIDGYGLRMRLSEDPGFSHTRMVALTAQAMPDEVARMRQEGFDEILMKPFVEKELLDLFHISQEQDGGEPAPVIDDGPDFSPIASMTAGDASLLRQMIEAFIFETERDLELLEEAIRNKDWPAVSGWLHRLAGRTSQMGAGRLASRMRRKEILLRDGLLPAPSDREFAQLIKDITVFIARCREVAYQR